MKELTILEQSVVSGGEIIPGKPSNTLQCINIKLMINVGRGEPGFDETVAALAYQKHCGCKDFDSALSYVQYGETDSVIKYLRMIVFHKFI